MSPPPPWSSVQGSVCKVKLALLKRVCQSLEILPYLDDKRALNHQLEVSNEVLLKVFPLGASKLPEAGNLDFQFYLTLF